jgi:hypothetical protein
VVAYPWHAWFERTVQVHEVIDRNAGSSRDAGPVIERAERSMKFRSGCWTPDFDLVSKSSNTFMNREAEFIGHSKFPSSISLYGLP